MLDWLLGSLRSRPRARLPVVSPFFVPYAEAGEDWPSSDPATFLLQVQMCQSQIRGRKGRTSKAGQALKLCRAELDGGHPVYALERNRTDAEETLARLPTVERYTWRRLDIQPDTAAVWMLKRQ